jgi:hypothetical protein
LVCFLFWQHRRQVELARVAIKNKCHQLDLQLVSITFRYRLKTDQGRWLFHNRYTFEFSALGDDCYQGHLDMVGLTPTNFYLPVHHDIRDSNTTPPVASNDKINNIYVIYPNHNHANHNHSNHNNANHNNDK